MNIRYVSSSILMLCALLLMVPASPAQDLMKYRTFSLEAPLSSVLKGTGLTSADVKVIHGTPVLIQELTWWPPAPHSASSGPDCVEQILFSFYNGHVYKISVTYDRNAIKGMTTDDMVQSIAAKYGTVVRLSAATEPGADNQFDSEQKLLALWEDSAYSSSLVRSSYSEGFGLVILSKRLNAMAVADISGAVKLEEQQRPEKEAIQRKKEASDLEAVRQKNRKLFRP
jgi:hypothetical protein